MLDSKNGARAQALATLDVLDTPAEQAFDDIVYIAAQTCDTPIALVSLLDGDRQWFKARVGLDACETPIDQSVCKIEIDQPQLLEIADLTADPRTSTNELVTGSSAFRFYAGAPLLTRHGTVIGRLCVIDVVPRSGGLSDGQRNLLVALARQVGDQLELRRMARASTQLAALQGALLEVGDRIRRAETIAEMTRATAAIVGRVLCVDRAGFGLVDITAEHVDVEADWTAPDVASITGRHRFSDFGDLSPQLARGEQLVIDDVATDIRTADHVDAMRSRSIGALVNMPVREAGRTVAVFIVHATSPRRWTDDELAFLRSVADRLEAGVSRQRLDQQQQTLNGEISHRLKNMLAMVQAIASQTLRGIADRQPIETFERRLTALSTAHDVLMQRSWAEADIGSVVRACLNTFGFDGRVTAEGPAVPLGPRASLSLALLTHELMTNAVKYGALSNDHGGVTIGWRIADAADGSTLAMTWRESGGPPVETPASRGFGSKLIRLGLVGTGGVDLRYNADGVEADLSAPLDQLSHA